METVESRTVQAQQSAASFPLLVEQIVGEVLKAKSLPEVSYLMGRILGVAHLIDISALTLEQIASVRSSLEPLLAESHFWKWASTKPYGYAGDFVALEHCYDNVAAPQSSDIGALLDRWLLDSQLASGVRERKDMLSAFIERKANVHFETTGKRLRLLSLASGSARELRDLSPEVLEKIDITLVDQDPRSLQFAKDNLPASVTGLQANALRLRPSSFSEPFDLVYSFGFFDYLVDDVIVHCLNFCRDVTASGGSVIFPLKMNSKYRFWLYDVCLDWRFIKRELPDGLALAKRAHLDVVELLETANESVVFYHCVPHLD